MYVIVFQDMFQNMLFQREQSVVTRFVSLGYSIEALILYL